MVNPGPQYCQFQAHKSDGLSSELIRHPATREVVGIKTDKEYIRARRAVILATGGFSRNEEMVHNYLPAYVGSLPMCALMGIDGDGIRVAQALGADLVNMGLLNLLVGVQGGLITVKPGKQVRQIYGPRITIMKEAPCVLVTKKGRRFVDEYMHYELLGPKMREVEDQACWCIFDQNALRMSPTVLHMASAGLKDEIEQGMVKKASTLAELAKQISMDPDTLQDTVFTFNENAAKGIDPEFGRTLHLVPIKSGPFYAMQYKTVFVLTAGGLKINSKCRVIDVFGKEIPRLYAGGETAGGSTGKLYASGTALMNCFATGRIAGQNAAQEKAWV